VISRLPPVLLLLLLLCPSQSPLLADTSSLKIATLGQQGASLNAAVSNAICASGGVHVIFTTAATNLVSSDTNSAADVFLRDTDTGAISLISGDLLGTPGDGASGDVLISDSLSSTPDGRFVTFSSRATNLISPSISSGLIHVYRHDRNAVQTELITKGFSGEPTTSGPGFDPSISQDGTKVALMSPASDLVSDDNNSETDIFVRNLNTQSTVRASVSSSGQEGVFSSLQPQISADGNSVLFGSFAALVPDKSSTNFDFFVKDLTTGTLERVNNSLTGGPSISSSQKASISADGRFVAFSSFSSDHTTADNNSVADVFVYDRQTKTTRIVSTDGAGQPVNDAAHGLETLEISADGRFVLFDSLSSQLVKTGKPTTKSTLFLKDTQSGGIGIVDISPTGLQPNSSSTKGRICNLSPLRVLFQNSDDSLTSDTANGVSDFYLAEVVPPQPPPFEKGSKITAPPEVSIVQRTATVTLASFKGVSTGKSKKSGQLKLPQTAELTQILARAAKARLNYVVTLTSGKGKSKRVLTKNSARNTVTYRNLPPATYTVKYTVQATQGGKVLFKTKPSPGANFTINK
jgi:hypothetical protein